VREKDFMKKYVAYGDLEKVVKPEIDKWLNKRKKLLLKKLFQSKRAKS